jgi:histidinol-phosphate aminotransferase
MSDRKTNPSSPKPKSLIRPLVHGLHAYVPGEQPKVNGLIKLNTNENPFPPSGKVLKAIKRSVDERLRLYPNPRAQPLRERLAKLHKCPVEQIIVGNGSDELLALATRAFVEPGSAAKGKAAINRETIQYFTPSYSLYPVLADIHGARRNEVPLHEDYSLPSVGELKRARQWNFRATLTYVTTPNAPSGRGYATAELEALCVAQKGVTILDEAYVDFANENAMSLALKYPHVIVSRTFSKSYSLCFQRIGYFVGHPEMIAALDKIRDSYNVTGLGQASALATLADLPYYRANFKTIVATRDAVSAELARLGFEVLPSQANFLLVHPPRPSAKTWFEKLRERKILVRWFDCPGIRKFLRITIGTEREMAALLRAVRSIQAA